MPAAFPSSKVTWVDASVIRSAAAATSAVAFAAVSALLAGRWQAAAAASLALVLALLWLTLALAQSALGWCAGCALYGLVVSR